VDHTPVKLYNNVGNQTISS